MENIAVPAPPKSNLLVLFDPKGVRLKKDRPGSLLLMHEGKEGEEQRVKPFRTFPLTDPDHYISFLDDDENEVGMIEDPALLDAESREMLFNLLEQTYFLPVVLKIRKITEDFGVYRWDVETDKGDRIFEVRGREDVRIVSNGHVIVRDIDGNRYHILSLNKLDNVSRTWLDLLL